MKAATSSVETATYSSLLCKETDKVNLLYAPETVLELLQLISSL